MPSNNGNRDIQVELELATHHGLGLEGWHNGCDRDENVANEDR
jgi:hypothetical protein